MAEVSKFGKIMLEIPRTYPMRTSSKKIPAQNFCFCTGTYEIGGFKTKYKKFTFLQDPNIANGKFI